MNKLLGFILFISFVSICYPQQNVLSLTMDEGSGNILNDFSGYNNNGTVVGTVPIVLGKYGNARSFGGGSYIEVSNSESISPTSSITVECWVNTSNITYGTLVRKSDAGQRAGYMLFLDNNGKPSFALIRSSSPINCYSQTAIQPNTWTHIAGTFDGSQIKVFINGNLMAIENYSGTIEQGTSPLGVGAVPRTSGNDPFTGLIDEVKIFNYAKTITNVSSRNTIRDVPNYNMSQNYPNPFNPSTTIRYVLPFDSKVVIKIYNTLGEDIALLKDEIISSGNYEVTFNASHLSSGIYFYSLTAQPLNGGESFRSVKKLVLVK